MYNNLDYALDRCIHRFSINLNDYLAAFLAVSWVILSIMLLIFYEESAEDNTSSKTSGSVESNVDEVEKHYPNDEFDPNVGFDPIDNPVNSRLLQSKTDFQQRTSVSRLTLEVWFE